MGYPTELLSDGETIEFEIRPHWRALIVPGIVTLAVLIGAGILIGWLNGEGILNAVGTWLTVGVAAFLFIVFAVRPFLFWITTQYVFTNRRIIIRKGLIAKKGIDMPLSKVNNVSYEISVMGRILNYGRLEVDSASDESLIIEDVPHVERIQREVNRLHEEDSEYRRGGTGRDRNNDAR